MKLPQTKKSSSYVSNTTNTFQIPILQSPTTVLSFKDASSMILLFPFPMRLIKPIYCIITELLTQYVVNYIKMLRREWQIKEVYI